MKTVVLWLYIHVLTHNAIRIYRYNVALLISSENEVLVDVTEL